MRNLIRMLGLSLLLAPAAVHADIMTGQSIQFDDTDFASGNTASKPWVIEKKDSGVPTSVWSVSGVNDEYRVPASLAIASADWSFDQMNVTWRATTSAAHPITSFTFNVSVFNVTVLGDDSFAWEYSDDNSTWHTLASWSSDTNDVWLGDQAYSAVLSAPTTTLYVRAVKYEGAAIAGDIGNFVVLGDGITSSMTVTTTAVPEAGSLSLIALAGTALLARRRA